MANRRLVTIGIPVLNEELNIEELRLRLGPIIESMLQEDLSVEVIINDNASTDASGALLENWAKSDSRIKVNHLPLTVPFQASILKLLQQSKGDAFILLQSDLQDPPEVLPKFIESWKSNKKIVAGVITRRSEGIVQRSIRNIFYKTLRLFSDGRIIVGFQDFYLIDRTIVDELRNLSAEGLFIRGHISTRFGHVERIPYERANRKRGKSKFLFPAKYSLALDGLLLFGTRFIRIISTISFGLFCIGVLGSAIVLVTYFLGYRASVPGWASLGMILFTLLSLFGMTTGLILEYLIRLYRFLIFSYQSKD